RPWPSMLRTLYKEEERFVETYFKRFGPQTYLVGDAARVDRDGYFLVIGRIDDVVNVSGHRLSTAEVESAIVAHSDVAEAAVIGQHDEDTGQAIVAFVTLQGELEGDGARHARRARSHLVELRYPRAVGAAREVLEQPRRLGLHERGDLVEDQSQLLLGALRRAHLDHVAQRAHVGRPDDVGAQPHR